MGKSASNGNGNASKSGGFMGTVKEVLNRGLAKAAQLAPPTDDALDALDLLKAQHQNVEKLFSDIESATSSRKRALFDELADMLAVHATIEEKIFYPNVKRPSTEDLLLESAEEHLGIKRSIADLLRTDVDDLTFDAKLKVLKELVVHHAKKEEEAKLFPIVRAEIDSDFLAALASEMIALMVDIQQNAEPPRTHVPEETDVPAPI